MTDMGGAPLAAVAVRITRASTGFVRETRSGASGVFVAALLPPGAYDVTFAAPAVAPAAIHGVVVHAADRIAVDVGLGDAVPAVQYVIDERAFQTLPLVNRHVAAVVALAPGVTSTLGDEPSFHFGPAADIAFDARRGDTRFSLDGAPPLLRGGTLLPLTPSLESLEEARVVVATSAVAWPHGAGVSLVTRSGTNAFRASAYDFHRDSALDANTYFRNHAADPAAREGPADLSADVFGYSAGGPIRRDALFFFWSQEWRRRRGEGDDAVLDGRQETGRIDGQAGPRWRFMARLTHDVLDEAPAPRPNASVGVARATTVLSDTAVNEIAYSVAVRDIGTVHGIADTVAVRYAGHALTAGGSFARDAFDHHFETFAQDSWRAHRALTVDLGVRASGWRFEPAAGIAWRPDARADTVIRAGFSAWETLSPERQWLVGIGRRLYARGAVDAAYVGRRSDAFGRSPALRYDGLLAHFRHDAPGGFLDVAYTLGGARRHVFNATYARDVRGFTIAGVTSLQSGPPGAPVTLAGGGAVRVVGDPFRNLPSDQYYLNPAAFAPPGDGRAGSPSAFRLPGRNQWDVSVSRAWRIHAAARVRLRADVFNVFNHTQFTGVDTACTAAANESSCAVANTTLGQYTSARAPRQVQLGIRFDWNKKARGAG